MEPEMNRFEARLRFVNENETLKEILNILSYATLFVSVYAFFYGLVVLFLREIPLGISFALTILLPFLLVSLIARLVKAPRPCDLFDFYEKKPRGKYSFPDRAVFSHSLSARSRSSFISSSVCSRSDSPFVSRSAVLCSDAPLCVMSWQVDFVAFSAHLSAIFC